jgi:hypothetical protein
MRFASVRASESRELWNQQDTLFRDNGTVIDTSRSFFLPAGGIR